MTTTSEPSVNTPPPGGELPPATLEGWFVLHQSFRIDWPSFKTLDADTAAETLAQFQRVMDEWTVPSDGGWSGAYRVAGAGVDLLVIHFRENLDGLIAASHSLALTDLADSLLLDHEYVSVVELGLYALTADLAERVDPNDHEAWQTALAEGLEAEREKAFVRRRLYPVQPDEMPYVCYYPMDKRREPSQNWYKLSLRGPGCAHESAWLGRPTIRGSNQPGHQRLNGARRLGVGGDALGPGSAGVQAHHLGDALR